MIFDGDRDRIEPYLRELADLVGLRDWRILVSDDPPEHPEHAACIDVRYGLKVAVVSFHPQWAESEPEQFRNTCCHELLHAHVNHVRWPLNNVADLRHLGRRVALYHAELIEAGMDGDTAKHLTDEFQDHLLSIVVGPHVYPPLDMSLE
jgi:hypothetical protein